MKPEENPSEDITFEEIPERKTTPMNFPEIEFIEIPLIDVPEDKEDIFLEAMDEFKRTGDFEILLDFIRQEINNELGASESRMRELNAMLRHPSAPQSEEHTTISMYCLRPIPNTPPDCWPIVNMFPEIDIECTYIWTSFVANDGEEEPFVKVKMVPMYTPDGEEVWPPLRVTKGETNARMWGPEEPWNELLQESTTAPLLWNPYKGTFEENTGE